MLKKTLISGKIQMIESSETHRIPLCRCGFIMFIMLLSGVLSAQSIQLLDADSKAVVPFASVELSNMDKTVTNTYVSSATGSVSVPYLLPMVVRVHAVGYKPYEDTLQLHAQSPCVLYLNPDILYLNEYVVTATRTAKLLKDVPVITHVIGAEQIEQQSLDNIQVLLENALPGVEFQRHGTSQDIDIQGLGGRNILLLIDGERMAGETRGNIDYDRIQTEDIERVEIVKGASSALYGSQAMGAVVNIISKQHKDKVYAEFSAYHKATTENNFANVAQDDAYYSLKKDLDRRNANYNMLFGFNIKSWQANTFCSWKTTDAYQLYDTDSLVKSYVHYDTVVRMPKANTPVGIEGSQQFSIGQSVSYTWGRRLKAEGNIKYYNRHKYDFYKEDKRHDYFDDISYGIKLSYFDLKHTTIDVSLAADEYNKYDYKERLQKADLNYKDKFFNPKLILGSHWRQHKYLIGAEYYKQVLMTDMFVYGQLIDKQSDTYTFFVQDDVSWTNKLSMVVGVRAQYNTAFHFQFTPKLSVMYKLNTLNIRANYAMGYRAPSLKELYMNWNHLNMFMIEGNKNLRPETNHYSSLSAEYSHNILRASISVYNNVFSNKIEGQWANNQSVYRYQNVSQSRLYGVDIAAILHLKPFVVEANYAYVNDDNRKEGIRLTAISPHTANIQLAYKWQKNNYKLRISLGAKYIGSKHFFVQDDLVVAQDTISDYYAVDYKAYTLWRCAVYQQFVNGVSLVVGVDNVFNYSAPMITFNSYTGTRRLFFVKMKLKIDALYKRLIQTRKT